MTTTTSLQPLAPACDVCDREASPTLVLAPWYGLDLCDDCWTFQDAQAKAGACVCLDCLRHQHQHRQEV